MKGIVLKCLFTYLMVGFIFIFYVVVSGLHGAGWRPALAGTPIYVTMLLLATIKFVRDAINIYKVRRVKD